MNHTTKNICVAVALSLSLSACAGTRKPDQYESDYSASLSAYNAATDVLTSAATNPQFECTGQWSDIVGRATNNMENIATIYYEYLAGKRGARNPYGRQMTSELLPKYNQMALNLRFGHAELLKSRGCYNEADSIYRGVLNNYVGSSFASYRERARIEIDDLRRFRSKY